MYSNVKIWKRKLKVIFPLLVIFIDNKNKKNTESNLVLMRVSGIF